MVRDERSFGRIVGDLEPKRRELVKRTYAVLVDDRHVEKGVAQEFLVSVLQEAKGLRMDDFVSLLMKRVDSIDVD